MTSLTQALLNAKVGDLPKDFHVTMEVDDYEVMVITERQVSVTVHKKKGPGKGARVVVYDPDPDLTVAEIYRKARDTLEVLVRRR
jgi:hypothetical protein